MSSRKERFGRERVFELLLKGVWLLIQEYEYRSKEEIWINQIQKNKKL